MRGDGDDGDVPDASAFALFPRAVYVVLTRRVAQLTRGLRARLAYASYKAANNLSHVPLPVLEDRIHAPSPSPAPQQPPSTPAHKRRAAMAPPHSPSRSLYASLLGPPPKRPRHIYGPTPVTSSTSSLPGPSPADLLPPYPAAPATPRKPPPGSPRQHAPQHGPSSPFVNGGQGRTVRTVLQGRARSTVTEKEDMNAAATLTALMFNRASPRQRGDDAGGGRTTTPAPSHDQKLTEDADAAELMLYLATSPSPARPTVARRTAPGSMGRVLFAGAGAGGSSKLDRDTVADGGDITPALTAGQSSIPSSQETNVPSQLLPPPPSPSRPAAGKKSASASASASPFDVSRRLFGDDEESSRMSDSGARFGLGKGIDLVEAK